MQFFEEVKDPTKKFFIVICGHEFIGTIIA